MNFEITAVLSQSENCKHNNKSCSQSDCFKKETISKLVGDQMSSSFELRIAHFDEIFQKIRQIRCCECAMRTVIIIAQHDS